MVDIVQFFSCLSFDRV